MRGIDRINNVFLVLSLVLLAAWCPKSTALVLPAKADHSGEPVTIAGGCSSGRRCRRQKEISRFDRAKLTQNFLPLDCPSPTQKANLL